MYKLCSTRTFRESAGTNYGNLLFRSVLGAHVPSTVLALSCFTARKLSISLVKHLKAVDSITSPPKRKQKQKAMPPRPLWLINEAELEEKFIKGGGPGGQKINKSNIKVQITHKPTGIVVNSQDSRSQEKNRAKAREILALRLEQMQNPDTCRLNVLADKKRVTKRNRAKKAAKKHKNKSEDIEDTERSLGIDEQVMLNPDILVISENITEGRDS